MTTSTTQNEANVRSSRTPSRRDFEIFHMAQILGLTHAEIALDRRLTRRRVSQVVARVRRWLSLHPCQDPRLASEMQRQQLARHTERMHLELILGQARDELLHGKKELTTTTTKDDSTSTTTVRQQPFNVQVLKTYLRAVQALAKLQQQPDVNLPTPEECQFPWLEGAINEVYDQWEGKIWSGKLKPQGIYDLIEEIVAAVLKAAATQAACAGGTPSKGVDSEQWEGEAVAAGGTGASAETAAPVGRGSDETGSGVFGGDQSCHEESCLPPKTPDPFGSPSAAGRGSPDPADTQARSASEGPGTVRRGSPDSAQTPSAHELSPVSCSLSPCPSSSTLDLGPATLD